MMGWLKFFGVLILSYIGSQIIFRLIIDPVLVPLIGMRPVLAAVTAAGCIYPSINWAYFKWINKKK